MLARGRSPLHRGLLSHNHIWQFHDIEHDSGRAFVRIRLGQFAKVRHGRERRANRARSATIQALLQAVRLFLQLLGEFDLFQEESDHFANQPL